MLGLTIGHYSFLILRHLLTMSAHRRTSSTASAKINQFIRPNKTSARINTASITERLVLKGAGFATSDEVTVAMREGVAAELTDAMMAALRNRFD